MIRAVMSQLGTLCYEYYNLKNKKVSSFDCTNTLPLFLCILSCIQLHLFWFFKSSDLCLVICGGLIHLLLVGLVLNLSVLLSVLFPLKISSQLFILCFYFLSYPCLCSLFLFLPPSIHSLSQFALLFLLLFLPLHLVLTSDSV